MEVGNKPARERFSLPASMFSSVSIHPPANQQQQQQQQLVGLEELKCVNYNKRPLNSFGGSTRKTSMRFFM